MENPFGAEDFREPEPRPSWRPPDTLVPGFGSAFVGEELAIRHFYPTLRRQDGPSIGLWIGHCHLLYRHDPKLDRDVAVKAGVIITVARRALLQIGIA